MASNIDNLNFKVILDDKDFNTRVEKDIELAKKLNVELSQLLQAKVRVNAISATEAASAKRASDILTKQATNQEKVSQAKAKTAEAEEKVATQAAKTAKEMERARTATSQTTLNVQRLATEQQRTATATQNAAAATSRAALAQRRLTEASRQTTTHFQTQSRLMNELKGYALGYLSVHGASQLLSSLVRVTGEFELQKTTLAAMLGDLNQAEGVITRIQGLAVESPFQFKELTTYAKQLSAFSVPAQELYDTTKMLADVSAGLGVGMDRIVLAYGQVRSAAFLRGQEVRQFTEAGIPILDELAKQFSELEGRAVSTGEVFDKISKRLVPFEMVAKVFKDMTSEGGKFYNMQEVQAETLRGKISNLKDAYDVMLNEIGKGQSENLKGAVDWARRLMQNYEETGRTLVELVAAYGVYKAALLTLTIVTNNFALANSKLYTSLINATKWAIKNPYVILAAGITAAGYAIYKNITALEGYEKVHKSFVETEEKYNASLSAEGVKLDALYAKLRLAKEGTEEYEKAKKQIYTQYAGYISDLKEEGVEVGNLATLYDSLKIKVEEYTKAKFRSLAQSDLDQTFEQEVSVVRDRYKTLVSEIESIRKNAGEEPLSAMDKEGLWQYITGDIATLWDMAENPDLKRIKRVLASKILPFGDIAKELQGDLRKIKSTYASDMQAIINLYGETSDELAENDPFKVPLGGDGEGGKSPAQKAIEEQIKSVQKLQDAYEKLMPYLNEVQMKSTLKSLFPNIEAGVIDSLDFDAELTRLADKLEEFDEDAAQRLRDTIGKDVAGSIVESFKAVEQYKKMMDSWLGEDFNLSGKGISFDISKIISNLNSEYAKIDQKRAKALDMLNKAQMGDELALAKVREVYGEEVWQKYLENGERVINELAQKERETAKQTADENIRDLAEKYVKESYFTEGIKLTDLGDKTLFQIRDLKKKLQDILNEEPLSIPAEIETRLAEVGVNPEDLTGVNLDVIFEAFEHSGEPIDDATKSVLALIQQIQQAGLSTEKFGDIIQKVFRGDLQELTEEEAKLLSNMVMQYLDQLQSLFQSIGEFAESTGNESLRSAANGLTEVMDILGPMAEKFAKGDWIGGLISGVTSLATKIFEAVSAQHQLAKAIEETAIQQRILNSEYAIMNGVEGAFGENVFKKFTNAYQEATKKYQDIQKDLTKQNKVLFGNEKNDTDGWGIKGGLAGGAALGAAIGSIFPGIGTVIGAGVGALIGAFVGGITDVALEADNYAKSLKEMAEEIGAPLTNEETGGYNLETLKTIKDTYKNLSKEDQAWLDQAIANTEIYENALTSMADYLSNVFGSIADNISESFITSFKESGEAALEYGDIMDEVATQIAKDIIKATLLENVFSDELTRKAAKELASGNTSNALAMIDSAMESAKELTPHIQEFLQGIEPYFVMGEQGTTDLGEGIKGITEDQANLLASYLNAIRADVSFSKTLWVKMDANLQRIADMFVSSPTLMEYQAQIAANTFNTATATQSILLELRDVMGYGDDGKAIKIIS